MPAKGMTRRISITLTLAIIALLVGAQAWHRYRFGHFLGYGLHTDVVIGDSDIGTNDVYYARIWNLSASTVEIEGCRLPGGYAGEGVLYRWDVQKWDSSAQQWSNLRGADNWVQCHLLATQTMKGAGQK